eukprot:CAMPEP_0175340822 /NCGR_PEP_ID=MMETSP0095-20121207/6029_1 /TAXON_ID=311494 /ORGANISM="Alexandrium monilatum, Strain CCMP3105" /LENGTH=217 /DNA_ID=CAMNT_0016638229 /DNA_START=15 /DNA_END=667 /DNA_ORIENTATION=+
MLLSEREPWDSLLNAAARVRRLPTPFVDRHQLPPAHLLRVVVQKDPLEGPPVEPLDVERRVAAGGQRTLLHHPQDLGDPQGEMPPLVGPQPCGEDAQLLDLQDTASAWDLQSSLCSSSNNGAATRPSSKPPLPDSRSALTSRKACATASENSSGSQASRRRGGSGAAAAESEGSASPATWPQSTLWRGPAPQSAPAQVSVRRGRFPADAGAAAGARL